MRLYKKSEIIYSREEKTESNYFSIGWKNPKAFSIGWKNETETATATTIATTTSTTTAIGSGNESENTSKLQLKGEMNNQKSY